MNRSRSLLAIIAAITALSSATATPADACSPPPDVETQLFVGSAPAGGTWWLADGGGEDTGGTVHLTGLDGAADVDVDIVSTGLGSSIALAVPDVAPGSRYLTPENFAFDTWGYGGVELAVSDGDIADAIVDEAIPLPALRVDVREVRSGYRDVFVSPFDGMCEQATGWWDHSYREGAFAVIDVVPEGFVLDLAVRYPGDDGFSPVSMANEILYDADAVTAVDEYVPGLPDANEVFTIHARFRRVADGAVGDVASVDVELDPTETNRTEFVGCASVPAAPLSLLGLTVLALRRRRR
ncbi:MAG TPA: hypothetical protein VGF99_08135 [Myxococcota bacterium]